MGDDGMVLCFRRVKNSLHQWRIVARNTAVWEIIVRPLVDQQGYTAYLAQDEVRDFFRSIPDLQKLKATLADVENSLTPHLKAV